MDGSEWLNPTVKSAFHSKFIESNDTYSFGKKLTNEGRLVMGVVRTKTGGD